VACSAGEIAGRSNRLPAEVEEGDIARSADEIPGRSNRLPAEFEEGDIARSAGEIAGRSNRLPAEFEEGDIARACLVLTSGDKARCSRPNSKPVASRGEPADSSIGLGKGGGDDAAFPTIGPLYDSSGDLALARPA